MHLGVTILHLFVCLSVGKKNTSGTYHPPTGSKALQEIGYWQTLERTSVYINLPVL